MTDVLAVSPWLWVVAPLVVMFAYTVLGVTGFGSTLVTVPILAHFFPVTYLVPLMALLDLGASLFVGRSGREHLSREELRRLVPGMFVGFALGFTVLVNLPQEGLRTALGVFVLAVGLHSLANPVTHRSISRWWAVPAGITGGAVATLFGAGGSIHATYLSGRLRDARQVRATVAGLISISTFARAILYAIGGLVLHAAMLAGVVLLAPFAWAGVRLGGRIHLSLTQAQMRRGVGALLVASGSSLLVRVLL